MSNIQLDISEKIASEKIRVFIHLFLILTIAFMMLVYDLFNTYGSEIKQQDKLLHFQVGRISFVVFFYFMYVFVTVKVLLKRKPALTIRLLRVPAFMTLIMLISSLAVILLASLKELYDSAGFGHVEWQDFTFTLDGAFFSHYKSMIFILGLSPILIPLDILLQFPQKYLKMKHSHSEISQYAHLRKNQDSNSKATVLLVEDD